MKTNEYDGNSRFINGLFLANVLLAPTTCIFVSAGAAASSDGLYLITLPGQIGKYINAPWAPSLNNTSMGGLDTGTVAPLSTYFLHLIRNLTTGATDALYSLSATAPVMPTGFTVFRRIGVILTDGSSNIRQFVQKERAYYWAGGIYTSGISATTTPTNQSITGIPGTIRSRAFGTMNALGNGFAANIGGAGTSTPVPSVVQGSGPVIYNNSVTATLYVGGDFAGALHSTTGAFSHVAENGQLNVSCSGSQTVGITIQGFEDISL